MVLEYLGYPNGLLWFYSCFPIFVLKPTTHSHNFKTFLANASIIRILYQLLTLFILLALRHGSSSVSAQSSKDTIGSEVISPHPVILQRENAASPSGNSPTASARVMAGQTIHFITDS